jgi:hypothetical protein
MSWNSVILATIVVANAFGKGPSLQDYANATYIAGVGIMILSSVGFIYSKCFGPSVLN